jgi:hypothetical protein
VTLFEDTAEETNVMVPTATARKPLPGRASPAFVGDQ